MNVTYDDRLRSLKIFPIIKEISRSLEENDGRIARQATLGWELVDERNGSNPEIRARFTHEDDELTETFAASDFGDEWQSTSLIHHLWRTFLVEKSSKILRKLETASREAD